MEKDVVTVFLPTVSATYASQSLKSLLAQTHKNIEIFVSDNTAEKTVINSKEIIELISRSKHVKALSAFPETNGDIVVHHTSLLKRGKGSYFKFLFDDDLLSPLSIEHLVQIAIKEEVAGVFHSRYNFHDDPFEIYNAQNIEFGDSIYKKLNFTDISEILFKYCINIFSEPSFSMYRNDVKSIIKQPIELDGLKLRYLGDVALPLLVCENFSEVVISTAKLGFFRRHSLQDSSINSPVRLSGFVEWELISRYLNQKNRFSDEKKSQNKNRLAEIYLKAKNQFPFLIERFAEVIANDKEYIVDKNFKEFYFNCRKLQGLE